MAYKYGQKNKKVCLFYSRVFILTYICCLTHIKNATATTSQAGGTNTAPGRATRNRAAQNSNASAVTTTTTTTAAAATTGTGTQATIDTTSNIPIDPQLLEHDRQQREASSRPVPVPQTAQSVNSVSAAPSQPSPNPILFANASGTSANTSATPNLASAATTVPGTSTTGTSSVNVAAHTGESVAQLMERIRQLEGRFTFNLIAT